MIKSKKYTGVYYNQLKNDKSYYITYNANGKKVWLKIGLHSEGVREAYCFKKRAELTAKLRLGELPDFANRKKKIFHEAVLEFFAHKNYPAKTEKDLLGRYRLYVKPAIGDLPLQNIETKDIAAIHKKITANRALQTAQIVIGLINSVFIFAIERGECKTNPCKNFKLPKIDNKRERFLDKEEMQLLIDTVRDDHDLHLFVVLALTTGGRLSAICQLKKKDINFQSGIIHLRDEKNNETYKAFLSKRAGELLDMDHLRPNDSIFKKQQRTIQRKLQRILNRLFNTDLEKDDRKNRVVVHTLRHTFASHLAINGTPIFTIKELMNHKDITQTLRYAKLAPDSGRDMVETIL